MSKTRDLRFLETAPDNYVDWHQRQRQWSFFSRHPLLWRAYRLAARIRCAVVGHEWSPCFEEEKFNLHKLGKMTTHCLFCGASSDT
jgi:hypothetical protein